MNEAGEQKCFQMLVEGRQRWSKDQIVQQIVPNGGNSDWESPAANGRQFGGWHQQTVGPSTAEECQPGRLA